MPANAVISQLAAFLSDLVLLACLAAAGLYGLWRLSKSPGLPGLGRLSLVLAFCGLVALFAVGPSALHGLNYPQFFLFVLVGTFLLLEFLFQVSVLGPWVALAAAVLASVAYWPLPPLPLPAAPTPAVAYWGVMRDMAVTTGAAITAVGLGAAAVLIRAQQARGKEQPNTHDLKDVIALLGRAAPLFYVFGVLAAGFAVAVNPRPLFADWWGVGWLVVTLVASIAWYLRSQERRFQARALVLLALLHGLGLAAFYVRALARLDLTPWW